MHVIQLYARKTLVPLHLVWYSSLAWHPSLGVVLIIPLLKLRINRFFACVTEYNYFVDKSESSGETKVS